MNSKINLKHHYTLIFGENNTFHLRVETEDSILDFDGTALGDIYESSSFEMLSEEKTEPMTLEEYEYSTTEFLKDWEVEPEVAEAIVRDLAPWFEIFAKEERELDAWEKVLIERVEELELKERNHYDNISDSVARFRKWVSEASEYEIVDNAEFEAKRVHDVRETYRVIWAELNKAKAELQNYKGIKGLQ